MSKTVPARLARLSSPMNTAIAFSTMALANEGAVADEHFAIRAQSTLVAQGVAGLAAPYLGPNSLTPHQIKQPLVVTVFAGARRWEGGELWINPEIDQRFGMTPTPRVLRAFPARWA